MSERPAVALSGWVMGAIWLVPAAGTPWAGLVAQVEVPVLVTVLWFLVLALWLSGFAIVQPNQSRMVILFGGYLGTVRTNGWVWTWPLTVKRTISLRVQNFESEVIKVDDAAGNPVETSAVIVWRVVDTARAVFNVENYSEFVRVQTETAVRHVAWAIGRQVSRPEDQPDRLADLIAEFAGEPAAA